MMLKAYREPDPRLATEHLEYVTNVGRVKAEPSKGGDQGVDGTHVWWDDLVLGLAQGDRPVILWQEVDDTDMPLSSISSNIGSYLPHGCSCQWGSGCDHSVRRVYLWDDSRFEKPRSVEWDLAAVRLGLKLYKQQFAISAIDKPGRDFTILPKSVISAAVPALIETMSVRFPERVVKDNRSGDVTYLPTAPEIMLMKLPESNRAEQLEHGVPILVGGAPTRAALLATAMNNPTCQRAVQLRWCTPEALAIDDQRFVLAKAAGNTYPHRDHTLVVDPERANSEAVGHYLARNLHHHGRRLVELAEKPADYEKHDLSTYLPQYADGVASTDEELLRTMASYAPRSGIVVSSGQLVTDVCNDTVFEGILPFMAYIHDGARVYLRNKSLSSHKATKALLENFGESPIDLPTTAGPHAELLRWAGGLSHRAQAARLFAPGFAHAVHGSVENLRSEEYQLIVSPFGYGSWRELTVGQLAESMLHLSRGLAPGGHLIGLVTVGEEDNTWDSGGETFYSQRMHRARVESDIANAGLMLRHYHETEAEFRPGARAAWFHAQKSPVPEARDDRMMRIPHLY